VRCQKILALESLPNEQKEESLGKTKDSRFGVLCGDQQ
jgi:hypothetical protein